MLTDSVFDRLLNFASEEEIPYADDRPLLPVEDIIRPLDEIEVRYEAAIKGAVYSETDRILKPALAIASKPGKKKPQLEKIEWNPVAGISTALYALWHEGWQLGQQHATRELNLDLLKNGTSRKFTEFSQTARFASDEVFIAYPPDYGIPLSSTNLREAIIARNMKLANDVTDSTARSIRGAVLDSVEQHGNNAIPKRDRDLLVSRINLALGRQSKQEILDLNKGIGDPLVKTQLTVPGTQSVSSRAKTIARTELSAAYSLGRLQVYNQSGRVAKVRWQAIGDLATCPVCRSRNGTVHELNGILSATKISFKSVYDPAQYVIPAHPRDRCHWEPVFDNDEDDQDKLNDEGRDPRLRQIVKQSASWAAAGIVGKIGSTIKTQQELAAKERERAITTRKLFINVATKAGGTALSLSLLYALLSYLDPDQAPSSQTQTRPVAPSSAVMDARSASQFPLLAGANIDLANVSAAVLLQYGVIKPKDVDTLRKLVRTWLLTKQGVPPEKAIAGYLLPPEFLRLYPWMRDIGDVRQITVEELMRRGMARDIGEKVIDYIRKALGERLGLPPVRVREGVDLARSTPEQIQKFLPANLANAPKVADSISRYITNRTATGNPVTSITELKNVPGVGQKTIDALSAKEFTDNINALVLAIDLDERVARTIAAQLGIGPKKAAEIIKELRERGQYLNVDDLIGRLKSRLKGTSLDLSVKEEAIIRRSLEGKLFVVPVRNQQQALATPVTQSLSGIEDTGKLTGKTPSRAIVGKPPAPQIAGAPITEPTALPPARSPLTPPAGQMPYYQAPVERQPGEARAARTRAERARARRGEVPAPSQQAIPMDNREIKEAAERDRGNAIAAEARRTRDDIKRVEAAMLDDVTVKVFPTRQTYGQKRDREFDRTNKAIADAEASRGSVGKAINNARADKDVLDRRIEEFEARLGNLDDPLEIPYYDRAGRTAKEIKQGIKDARGRIDDRLKEIDASLAARDRAISAIDERVGVLDVFVEETLATIDRLPLGTKAEAMSRLDLAITRLREVKGGEGWKEIRDRLTEEIDQMKIEIADNRRASAVESAREMLRRAQATRSELIGERATAGTSALLREREELIRLRNRYDTLPDRADESTLGLVKETAKRREQIERQLGATQRLAQQYKLNAVRLAEELNASTQGYFEAIAELEGDDSIYQQRRRAAISSTEQVIQSRLESARSDLIRLRTIADPQVGIRYVMRQIPDASGMYEPSDVTTLGRARKSVDALDEAAQIRKSAMNQLRGRIVADRGYLRTIEGAFDYDSPRLETATQLKKVEGELQRWQDLKRTTLSTLDFDSRVLEERLEELRVQDPISYAQIKGDKLRQQMKRDRRRAEELLDRRINGLEEWKRKLQADAREELKYDNRSQQEIRQEIAKINDEAMQLGKTRRGELLGAWNKIAGTLKDERRVDAFVVKLQSERERLSDRARSGKQVSEGLKGSNWTPAQLQVLEQLSAEEWQAIVDAADSGSLTLMRDLGRRAQEWRSLIQQRDSLWAKAQERVRQIEKETGYSVKISLKPEEVELTVEDLLTPEEAQQRFRIGAPKRGGIRERPSPDRGLAELKSILGEGTGAFDPSNPRTYIEYVTAIDEAKDAYDRVDRRLDLMGFKSGKRLAQFGQLKRRKRIVRANI